MLNKLSYWRNVKAPYTEESLCSNSENPSLDEECHRPPPPPQYEFSQKPPDGLGFFCWGLSVCFLCSSLFLDTHYSITHTPAALVSIFRRKCLNKLFMLVAIENEKPFRVSPQSLALISLQYSILEINVEELFHDGAVKMTSLSLFSEWWKCWARQNNAYIVDIQSYLFQL